MKLSAVIEQAGKAAFLLAAALAATPAWASPEDSGPKARQNELRTHFSYSLLADPFLRTEVLRTLDPSIAFSRSQAVLDHFGVPAEPESQDFFTDLQNVSTVDSLSAALPYLDLGKRSSLYNSIVSAPDGSTELQVYQDPGSKRVLDYSVKLASVPAESTAPFHVRLLAASANPGSRPLTGLRVALDPGHMGGDFWDKETGKFVRDRKGRKLSEGVMALQIALLLEEKLRAAGAETFITHRTLGPVSQLPYQNFEIRPYALETLRESSPDAWFQELISRYPAGPALYSAFSGSSDFRKLFSGTSRWHYFILGADLDARVQAIQAFRPDITLIIHLDTSDPPGDPNGVNTRSYDGTKAYVPGGFFADEFASRGDRKFFGRHLLDTTEWSASLRLSRAVVGEIHDRLGVRFDPSDGGNSLRVESGVLARNLNVQRKLVGQAVSYVECLFYNDPSEFEALYDARNPMEIDGQNHPYSDRLAQIADALDQAVLKFVREYSQAR